MTGPQFEVQIIEHDMRHYVVGRNEQQSENLSKVTNSTVKAGCVSQLVKGELHERWPNFTNNWRAIVGVFWGEELAMPAVSR